MADPIKNFAYSTVSVAPSPAASGTSLTVEAGHGARFPAPSTDGAFNLVVWPSGALPLPTNAEIMRVTARATDVLTIMRAQEGTSARAIVVGDQIALAMTSKVIDELAALVGRAGGQVVKGGTASGEDLTLMSTAHATKGSLFFGTSGYDEVNNRLGLGTNTPLHRLVIVRAADVKSLHITGTITTNSPQVDVDGAITNSADGMAVIKVGAIVNTAGATREPRILDISTTFQPSSSLNNAYGLLAIIAANPDSGATISVLYAGFFRTDIHGNDGAITQAVTLNISAPNITGTMKPTSQWGINIGNQGLAGITTAVGIKIEKPTGATNNFYMEFPTADATAAGTYHGRIPVQYNGLLKFIHIFNA